MSTEWFSAADLAKLGAELVAKLPTTERGALRHAKQNLWEKKVVDAKGGKGGKKSVFRPPDEILKRIYLFMLDNPYFLDSGQKGIPAEDYARHKENILVARRAKSSSGSPAGLKDFVLVPRYDVRASAGHGEMVHSEQIVDHLAFRKSWVRSELGCTENDLALITVKGDSMEPTLSQNDLILIDMSKNLISDNAVYVLQYDGSLWVKRIQRKINGSVIIKSDNPEYEIEELDEEQARSLKVLGMVVWYGRKI